MFAARGYCQRIIAKTVDTFFFMSRREVVLRSGACRGDDDGLSIEPHSERCKPVAVRFGRELEVRPIGADVDEYT
jgi:hypothetical protein